MLKLPATKTQTPAQICPESACPCCCSEEYLISDNGKIFFCNSCHYSTTNYDEVMLQLESFNMMVIEDDQDSH